MMPSANATKDLFHIVLYQPEIPPNTGNVMRLAANTGCRLHLVKPFGFHLDDRRVRRSGMDYRDLAAVTLHADWRACRTALEDARWFAYTTRGSVRHEAAKFDAGDVLVFGPETRGLPDDVLLDFPADRRLRLPMVAGSRSLNLANSVAVAVYEAWRQLGFGGAQ